MTEHLEITAANGTTFRVTYGIRTKYVKRPVVAFYDATYDDRFPPLGQYVAEYYPETIREVATKGAGLDLHMGIPSWQVDAESIGKIDDWVLHQEHNDYVDDNNDEEE